MDHRSDTRWLNDREMRAWRQFVETQDDLIGAIEADLTATGLTLGDYQVLVFLSEAHGLRLRMTDLAERLQLSPSGLTRRLDHLVQRGLVQRVASTDDRRVNFAELTDDGLQALVAAAPSHVGSVRRHLVDLLDEDELDALARIFAKVRRGLDG